MLNCLKDKVIIVTGGSGLLGREIVSDLMLKGAMAINADINEDTDLKKNTFKKPTYPKAPEINARSSAKISPKINENKHE